MTLFAIRTLWTSVDNSVDHSPAIRSDHFNRPLEGGIMREAMDRAARTGFAIDFCRVALKCGKLVRQGRHWRYGRRRFSNATVKQLIDEGIAMRDGDTVWASERRLST
jgi:hypothetical protein